MNASNCIERNLIYNVTGYNFMKMLTVPKLIYKFNKLPIKMLIVMGWWWGQNFDRLRGLDKILKDQTDVKSAIKQNQNTVIQSQDFIQAAQQNRTESPEADQLGFVH